ncbi:MAG TPA: sulfotransferase [Gemmatimonadales bacterium]|nr:sulfotransferase [Gemmatimonadales bacterium]
MTTPAVRLPTFIVAGAPKAGSTSLYFYLAQHPQVYMSPVKEPTFFGAADIESSPVRDIVLQRAVRDRGPLRQYLSSLNAGGPLVLEWDDYVELFRNARDEIAIGEASVSYLWQPSAAEAIHARLPGARLVFILRDPAERLFTHWLGGAWRTPRVSFRERFLGALEPDGLGRNIVAIGRYATHLRRFFNIFPRPQIRVVLYEDYRADARAVMREIFAFIGVDPAYPVDMSRRHGETTVPRLRLLYAVRNRLFGAAPVAPWLPERARRGLQWLYRRPPAERLDRADRRIVIDYYRDEILGTQELIGRDLSAWLR